MVQVMVGRLWRMLSHKLHDGGVPEPDEKLGTAHPAYQAALQQLLNQVRAGEFRRKPSLWIFIRTLL